VGKVGDRSNRRQVIPTPFLRRAGLYLGVAFEIPGTILGGLLVGYLLDNHFGTSPWLLIALGLVGFTAAFMRLIQWAKYFGRQSHGSRVEKDDTAN
jgi:F0F1-type ATP synthase assembly protein I